MNKKKKKKRLNESKTYVKKQFFFFSVNISHLKSVDIGYRSELLNQCYGSVMWRYC